MKQNITVKVDFFELRKACAYKEVFNTCTNERNTNYLTHNIVKCCCENCPLIKEVL